MSLRRPALPQPSRLAAIAAVLAFAIGAHAAALDARELAGRRIYREGESPSGGEITAIVAGSVVPASAIPCASCHGADGTGRREGGVVPSEVTWAALTKRYGHVHPSGRSHPPFDERSFARAVLEGVDPAGNALDPAMPRYSISRADLEDLVAYVKRLAEDVDPGIRGDELTVATVVPTRGRAAETGRAIRRTLEVSLEAVNARGGIHGRRVVLLVAEYDLDRETGVESLERMLATRAVFAVVAPFTPRDEAGLLALADRASVPVLGPVTPFTPPLGAASAQVFYALGGLREQVKALADRAANEGGIRRATVLHPPDALLDVAEAARERFAADAVEVELRAYRPGEAGAVLARSATRPPDAVLLLGGDAELRELARAAQGSRHRTLILVPGTLAARAALEAAPAVREDIRMAFPLVPGDRGGTAAGALERVASEQRLGPGERHAAAAAQLAVAVLAEGLRRAGRQLSREGLVAALERLRRFDAGFGPPLSYGPARRVGAAGAYIAEIDASGGFRPVGDFVEVE